MSNCKNISRKYFELSNNKDFDSIFDLLTDETIYISQNTGEYKGREDILNMMRGFFSKYKYLRWKINSIEESEENLVLIDFTFRAQTKEGETQIKEGLEYIKVQNEKIIQIEVKNK